MAVDVTELDKDALKDILKECFKSTAVFAKTFFPEKFKRPFSAQHYAAFEALDNDDFTKISEVGHRGFGKSTILNLVYVLKRVLFQQSKFVVIIAHNATKAENLVDTLRKELEFNQRLIKIFGPQRTERWSSQRIDLANGARILPLGAGQEVRGLLYDNNRPDLITLDDIETRELVKNSERRDELHRWIISDVCNCVDMGSKDWKIVALGNMLHFDSTMVRLGNDKSWHSFIFPICSSDMKSLWPEFMTDEAVKKKADEFRSIGKFDEFCMEFMCLPISAEDVIFKSSYFKHYDERDLLESIKKGDAAVESIVLIDPARTTEGDSCDTAIVGVGIDRRTNSIYMRDVDAGKFHPDDMIKKAFNMADRLGARTIGVEVTGLNEFITYPMRTLMMRERRNYEIIEIKNSGKKEDRIAGLAPFYKRGLVYHNRQVCTGLEAQQIAFPKAPKVDILDAASFIVKILEMGVRYFIPIDKYDNASLEAQYKSLKNEKPLVYARLC